ncbi:uncharacterized protein LOC122801571 isoform X2 [Protopterus annectens]|uniref:uncharacterized protein LOC122801571 isoform X2 n=1 Tax=Protopterus annectens TaxID=7888 RepID=UPI001CFA9B26|nr:uncharacterized protein LOC122801571 isoform X2 [Protopterus annectens]
MPDKKKQLKGKKSSMSDTAISLKKFMKTYENHCAQTQTYVSPTVKKGVQRAIENGKPLSKIILACPDKSIGGPRPVYLKPLIMAIRDERYMIAKELCVWNVQLNNQEIANLSILLELQGLTKYPFSKLELFDCGIDAWSVERLGKSINFSSLTSVNLDYNDELYLNGNYLQCEGSMELIRPLVDSLEKQEQKSLYESGHIIVKHFLEATQLSGIQSAVSAVSDGFTEQEAAQPPQGMSVTNKKKGKKKVRKKKKGEQLKPGPWLTKLHLADNGIDGRGMKGKPAPLEFIQMICQLIKDSKHLIELDLEDNSVGDLSGNEILEALKQRKEAKHPMLQIRVTARMNPDTFSAIFKYSKKLKSIKKHKKKKTKK